MEGDAARMKKKRKAPGAVGGDTKELREEAAPGLDSKKQKRNNKAQQQHAREEQNVAGASPKPPCTAAPGAAAVNRQQLAALPPGEQAAALLASYVLQCGPASYIEQEAFGEEHMAFRAQPPRELQHLLKAAVPSWRDTLARPAPDAPPGSPVVIIVSGAALRVIEIIKALPDFRRECSIPKLFSKHIKLEEQTEMLGAEQVCIAVGTPARLEKLVSVDALHLDRVTLLLIDCQRDIKQRSLLDIPEVRRDFWQLWRTHLATRVAAGRIKVGLFD